MFEQMVALLANNPKTTRRTAIKAGALALVGVRAASAQQPAPPKPPEFKVRRELKVGSTVATACDAVHLALQDAIEREKDGVASLTRYVFIPPWIEPVSGFQQVALIVNSVLSRTPNKPQPRLLQDEELGTAVVAIDFAQYVAKEEQLGELLALYERLAATDSWFTAKVIVAGDAVLKVIDEFTAGQAVEIKLTDGRWVAATFKQKQGSKLLCEWDGRVVPCVPGLVRPLKAAAVTAKFTFTAEPYLGAEGLKLFELTQSSVPIMRLDEWVHFTFSTINGGLYYELAGVEKNLGDTVAKFAGFDAAKKVLRRTEVFRLAQEVQRKEAGKRSILAIAAELDPDLSKSKAVMNESVVTGRQRSFLFVTGTVMPPADGLQLVAVTFDISEDNFATAADPQRNLTNYETYNGGEAIVMMANGLLLYLVFNAKDEIIATVPDNVAHDFQARKVRPNVATARVFSGTSCANCHDAQERNWGYQPVTNDIADSLASIVKILGDRGVASKDKLQELQRIASAFAADNLQLSLMIDGARLVYQRAVGLATGAKSSREVIAGIGDSHWGLLYDAVGPEHAVIDIAGQVLTRKDAQAWLLNNVDANPDPFLPDLFREDIVLDRLKRGLTIVPGQWRPIAPKTIERYQIKQSKVPVENEVLK